MNTPRDKHPLTSALGLPLAFCALVAGGYAQTTVFSDTFANSSAWTLSAASALSGQTINGKIRLRSGTGVLGPAAADRYAQFARTTPLAASGDFDPVLRASAAPLEWSFAFANPFNSSQSTSLAGEAANTGGDAHGFVVAASHPDFRNAGVGYVVTVSRGKRLSLARYSGGLAGSVTELITWLPDDPTDTGLKNVGAKAVAVRLLYVPSTETWTLSGAAIASGDTLYDPFPDPLSVSYAANDTKSVIDAVHTGQALAFTGLFMGTDATVPQIYLDNLVLRTVPGAGGGPPTEIAFRTDLFTGAAGWTGVMPATGFTHGLSGYPDTKYRIRSGGAAPGASAADRFAFSRLAAGFGVSTSGGFNPVLKDALASRIEWSLSFGGSLTDLSAPVLAGNPANGGGDAMGVIVAASDPDVRAAGVGYAVVVSQNRLKFVRYSGGLAGSVTELLGWTTADAPAESLDAIGLKTVRFVLSYERATDTWELKAGATNLNLYSDSLPMPRETSYAPSCIKSVVDGAHVATALPQLALFAGTDETVGQYYYDNLGIHLTVPKSLTATVTLGQTTGGVVNHSSSTYEIGTSLVLQAAPAAGYWFRGWNGDLATRANPLPVTLVNDLDLQPVFEPVPAPAMRVGTNLTAPSDGSSAYLFSNLFSQMRTWQTGNADKTGPWSTGLSHEIPADARGWPTQIPFISPSTGIAQVVHTILAAGLPENGTYTLDWDGSGSFEIDVQNNAVGGTRYRGFLTPASARPVEFQGLKQALTAIRITQTDPANPLRNIRLVRPGYAATHLAEPLHDKVQAKIAEFSGAVLRYMDWGATNASTVVTWSQRRKPSDYVESDRVSYERMIETSNLQQADMWVCVPHGADDDHVLKLARLIRYGGDGVQPYTSPQSNPVHPPLAPGLRVYVEYSNETWNTAAPFTQSTYVAQQGAALGYGSAPGDKFTARRSAQMWNIFGGVFADSPGRVVRVLAAQAANSLVASRRLAALSDPAINPSLAWPDVLAIAPYYGKNYEPAEISANGYPSAQQIEAVSDSTIAAQAGAVAAHWDMCRPAGLELVCYEGGQHFSGLYAANNDATLSAIFHDYFTGAEIYDDYRDYLDLLKSGHVSLFVHYTFIGRWKSTSASWWPILEEADSPASSSPRFQALSDWMEANPTP